MSDAASAADESCETYFNNQIVQETPLAGSNSWDDRLVPFNDTSKVENKLRHDLQDYQTGLLPSNSGPSLSISNKEVVDCDHSHLLGSPLCTTKDKGTRYNTRTPNLDKVAKFFRSNKSTTKENLLAKFEASHLEDTPLSQRKIKTSGKYGNKRNTSSTEYIALRDSEKNSLFTKGHDSDMELVVAPSYDGKLNDHADGSAISQQKSSASDNKSKSNTIMNLPVNDASSPLSNNKALQKMRATVEESDQPFIVLSQPDQAHPLLEDFVHRSISVFGASYHSHNSAAGEKIPETAVNFELADGNKTLSRGKDQDVRSDYISLSYEQPTETNDEKCDEVSMDNTRIDDTTAGTISPKWVLRPNNGGIFSSNRSTQIIHTEETQRITSQSDFPSKEYEDNQKDNLCPKNERGTQVVASFTPMLSEDRSKSPQREAELIEYTQVIQSQDHGSSSNFNTPSNLKKITFEPITEVPETSSPSKSRDVKNPDSSPATDQGSRNAQSDPEEDSQEKVHLQISSKAEIPPTEERSSVRESDTKHDTGVVVSEAELTQELPEVEDEGTQEINISEGIRLHQIDSDDKHSGPNLKSRKRSQKETVDRSATDEPEILSCKKRLKCSQNDNKHSKRDSRRDAAYNSISSKAHDPSESQSSIEDEFNFGSRTRSYFPKGILTEDEDFLSKSDIKFEDAVWCQYCLDYSYYPGRLISTNDKLESSLVYFETGKSITKNDDIYYLDIRVGDTVNLKGKKYVVVALECLSHEVDTIRCIRGFDTLHLKKKNNSGTLGKKTLTRRLAEISLDVKEWTKRPKLVLEKGSQTRSKAHIDLHHPIRGRKNMLKLSPRKVKSSEKRPIYREDSYTDNTEDLEEDPTSLSHHQKSSFIFELSRKNNTGKQIFSSCLFIFTGFIENRDELNGVINKFGGRVLDLGFSSLFDSEKVKKEYDSGETNFHLGRYLKENSEYEDYTFACLITTQHSRSLKYLETLALKWPILHWEFLIECIRSGELATNSIHQYLLPSGESYRLSFDPRTGHGIIKSNNIFQFYTNLIAGKRLNEQVAALKTILSGYVAVIYGNSDLDKFIRFAFACCGVEDLYQIPGDASMEDISEPLRERINHLSSENNNARIIIYVNKNKGISGSLLESLRTQISAITNGLPSTSLKIQVESKEWLIQTIINESSGFEDGQQGE